jgi:AraC-like DNA-binding protein
MLAVAALLDARPAVLALRRTLPGVPVLAGRSFRGLERLLTARYLDAIVLGLRALRDPSLDGLRQRFPMVPVLAFGAFRPDDGALLRQLESLGVSAFMVEGVDDAVAGDLVRRHTVTRRIQEALAGVPRALRLTEELQRRTWSLLVRLAGTPIRTAALARRVGVSREYLSRQFGAGGAPNLKRVIDLLRTVAAARLLGNPGYDHRVVARVMGFSTPSHFSATARRISGVSGADLRALGPDGVVSAFVRGATRSRSR